jgi:hypothetical protein
VTHGKEGAMSLRHARTGIALSVVAAMTGYLLTVGQRGAIRTVELDIPPDSLFASAEGRGFLNYLVRCTFPAHTEAQVKLPSETLSFKGGIGLAPAWAERPLSLSEQRWVSACLYALTNKWGKPVRVDLRGAHPRFGDTTDEEKQDFPLHEGGFFGNIFAPEPVAYVCEGADRNTMRELPIGRVRRCAQPSGESTPGGRPLSECGFVITGPCSSEESFTLDGESFSEVVHIWLPPTVRE